MAFHHHLDPLIVNIMMFTCKLWFVYAQLHNQPIGQWLIEATFP
jgi:hypothetical protein